MSGQNSVYEASPVKRVRATKVEMEQRARFLIGYAEEQAPVTVRGLYYKAETVRLPDIDKQENSYNKIQRQVLNLRRAGHMDYSHIADMSRWMRKPKTFDTWRNALQNTALTYRKSLWSRSSANVEVWCEKDALAGVLLPVTAEYDVPLMVTRGYTSETFAFEAVESYANSDRPYVILALYDFDRAGQDAARSLQEKVERFAATKGIEVQFYLLGLTPGQIRTYGLSTRDPKRNTVADKAWPYDFACELDAMAPNDLRALTQAAIEQYLPRDELNRLKQIEALEKDTLEKIVFSEVA